MSTRRILEILDDKNGDKLENVVTEIFNLIDSDKNNTFQRDEFARFLNILCDDMGMENLTLEEHGLLFNQLDDDKSGSLEKKEVVKFIKGFLERFVEEN